MRLSYFYNVCIICNEKYIDCVKRSYCFFCHSNLDFGIIEEIDEEQPNNKADINILDLLNKI